MRRANPARTAARRFGRSVRIEPGEFLPVAKAQGASRLDGARGFNSAKSVIHALPAGRSEPHRYLGSEAGRARPTFAASSSRSRPRSPGIQLSEIMPMLAEQMDKVTLIRSMSYTPVGLFNHTAAIYQMMTGYPPDKVSPSGQLEPPSPRDFPHMGCHISKMKPPDGAHAAVRRDAAAAAGIERDRQGRRRGIPGQGVRSLPALSGSEQRRSSSTISRCAPTFRRSA